MQLIVAGFHRSGTSLLTNLLRRAGLFVGDRLVGSTPSNRFGHFEDREVLALHRSVLLRHGDDWQWTTPFVPHVGADEWRTMRDYVARRDAAHAHWGFKDPRVCLFLGHWKHVMPRARYVVVYRDPGECVRSMESRAATEYFLGNGVAERHLRFFTEPDLGLRLWDTYNRLLVDFARAHAEDCLVLPFTALTAGFPVVDALNDRFAGPGGGLDPVATTEVFDPSSASTRAVPQVVHSDDVRRSVERTWHDLETLAGALA